MQSSKNRNSWYQTLRHKITSIASVNNSEEGNAMVEFLGLGFMLMVPTIYFLLSVFAVQSGTMAAHAAADQAAQTISNQPLDQMNSQTAQQAAQFAARDYGIEPENLRVAVSCGNDCSQSDSIRVNTTVKVQLPLIPWVRGASFAEVSSSSFVWGGRYR